MSTVDGFPFVTQSTTIQLVAAAAAAKFVATSAETDNAFAFNALPELNPNQPNHSNDAPNIT